MQAATLEAAMGLLAEAEAPVRVLRHLAWPASVRERFFADGARELPRVSYEPFDADPVRERLARARDHLGGARGSVADWLNRQADAIEHSAGLLEAAGTPEFTRHSRALFGAPGAEQPHEHASALDFAHRLEGLIDALGGTDLGEPPPACHLADDLAATMRTALAERFGDEAPAVLVVDELSANALAGPENVRIRKRACFTDRDVGQLIQHEALVHVLTSLNGRAQPALPLLACAHAGTTRTQEGLAVFAEFITGQMDIDRLQRLADRVLAIQMALDGADFLEVYRFFLERTDAPEQSFENTRRVFRGAPLTGGHAFTKDIVYLDGLLRVHNFMRTMVALHRPDLLRLLFVGKLDIEDVPALAELAAEGLCRPPRFLPPWASDLRFLVSYLAYSGFLNSVDLESLRAHYDALARQAPRAPDARG